MAPLGKLFIVWGAVAFSCLRCRVTPSKKAHNASIVIANLGILFLWIGKRALVYSINRCMLILLDHRKKMPEVVDEYVEV